MKTHNICFLFLLFYFMLPSNAKSENIILKPGNTYKIDNLHIMCVNEDLVNPIVYKECQYWGGYNNEYCRYEKVFHVIEDKKCVEECQYWNKKSNRCNYATKCDYIPEQKVFIESSCIKYSDFHSKCKEEKQRTIY